MVDEKKFSSELLEEFLNSHPKLKAEDSLLAKFAQVMAEMCAVAIAKYDRETHR